MKKVFALALLLANLYGAKAQSIEIKPFAGLALYQLTSDVTTSKVNGVLFNRTVETNPGGVFGFHFQMGDKLLFRPGIYFSKMTFSTTNTVDSMNGAQFKSDNAISFVSVPLRMGYKLMAEEDKKYNMRVFGGITTSMVLEVSGSDNASPYAAPATAANFSNLMMSADLGMGFDYKMVFVDLCYQIGVSPITNTGNSKVNIFNILVGLRIKS